MTRRFLLFWVLVFLGTSAFGQDVSKQNERKRQIEEEISFINNQLKSIAGKQKATTEQLSLIQKRVTSRQSLIHELDKRIAVINDEMTAKQREINRLQKELDTLETYYNKLIYNTYKNRDTRVWFMYLLSSENIGQGYRRFSFLKSLAGEVSTQAGKMREKQAELQVEREKLALIKAEAQVTKASREDEYRKLVEEQKQSQEDMRRLAKSEKQYRNDLAAKKKEIDRLNSEIQRILKATVKEQKKDNTKVDTALSGQFAQNRGKLPWPLRQGVITERFAFRRPQSSCLQKPEIAGQSGHHFLYGQRGGCLLCLQRSSQPCLRHAGLQPVCAGPAWGVFHAVLQVGESQRQSGPESRHGRQARLPRNRRFLLRPPLPTLERYRQAGS